MEGRLRIIGAMYFMSFDSQSSQSSNAPIETFPSLLTGAFLIGVYLASWTQSMPILHSKNPIRCPFACAFFDNNTDQYLTTLSYTSLCLKYFNISPPTHLPSVLGKALYFGRV